MTSAPSPAQTLPQQHLSPPATSFLEAAAHGFCGSPLILFVLPSGSSLADFRDVFLSWPQGFCVPQLFPPSSALLTPYETVSDLI